MGKRPSIVVGVCGGTGSGKSWLSGRLRQALAPDCVVVCQDWYYRDNSRLSPEESLKLNFDHPSAIETPLFLRDLDRLISGRAVEAPVYDYVKHGRTGESRLVEPAPVVVIEGLFVLHEPGVRERLDLSVYIDVADDLRLLRRIRRDCSERRVDLEETLRIYERCVMPMHGRYTAPSARHAAMVWRQDEDAALPDRLIADVRARLATAGEGPAARRSRRSSPSAGRAGARATAAA